MENYIKTYTQQIHDGRIIVGKWIKRLYDKIASDLEQGLYHYDEDKAQKAIDFIEAKCHHSEGRLAPNTLKLELWQKAFISCVFGLVDDNGDRHYREVFVTCARKQGKSLLCSAVVQQMIYNEGQYGAAAFMVAPKLDQADLVYNDFWQSVQLDPELAAKTKSRKADLYVAETNSRVKKLALKAHRADGFNPSLWVADECAGWPAEQGLRMYEVMASAMGARDGDGLILAITTAGYIEGGIYTELIKRSTRVLNGESSETRLLPFLYMVDDPAKWNDINELRKAAPNLDVSVSVSYMQEEIAKAEGSLSKRREFLAKYCCVQQNSTAAWLAVEDVNKCVGEPITPEMLAHSYAVAGIDLSQVRDLTAACFLVEKGGHFYVLAHFWLPGDKISEATARDGIPYELYIKRGFLSPSGGAFVDYNDCYNWIVEMVSEYEILPLEIGYDRYSADYLTQQLAQHFRVDDVWQGDNLWPILQQVGGLIQEGRIHIGDNELLKIHFLDSAIKFSQERGRGKLVKVNANTSHVDGMAALLDAFTVRSKWYDQIGVQLANDDEGDY